MTAIIYVDDTAIINFNEKHLQILRKHLKKAGLEIHPDKCFSFHPAPPPKGKTKTTTK